MAISPSDVKRVGTTCMNMSRIQFVAAGDPAQLRPILEPLGGVTVVK